MNTVRHLPKKSILVASLFLILIHANVLSQDTGSDLQDNSDTIIAVLPFTNPDGSSRVLPMVAERVFIGKLEGTEVYTVLDQDQLIQMLQERSVSIPDPTNETAVMEAARSAGIEQLLFGSVEKKGANYTLSTRLVRSSDGEVLVSKMVDTVGIEDLDMAAEEITREMSRTILSEEKAQVVEQKFVEAEKERIAAEEGGGLASFEELAEKDPDAALEKVGEPAREAIKQKVKEEVKEEARQEVVQEEIQKLYEEEKESKRQKQVRLFQFWSYIGFTGFEYWSSMSDMIALHNRMESGKYWGAYMNSLWDGEDPYQRYYRYKELSDIMLISSYAGEGLSLAGRTTAQFLYQGTNFGIPSGGRGWYASSLTLKAFADAGVYVSGLLGYAGVDAYNAYQHELSITDPMVTDAYTLYEDYRGFYNLYNYSSIASYSVLGLGAVAMTVAHLSPGDVEPIARSGKAKLFTLLGQFLSGASSISAQVALNYRSSMSEQRASQFADPAVSDDVTSIYENRFWVWSGVSWGLWAVGLASQLYALQLPGVESGGDDIAGQSPVAFSITPVPGGVHAVVGVSW